MSGTGTTAPPAPSGDRATIGPAIRRTRGLPRGRAVVGALLIAVAGVGVFAAYLQAAAAPDTSFLVARAEVAPGTRIADAAARDAMFEARPLTLPADVAARAVPVDAAADLVGRVVVAPLQAGDLLTRTDLGAAASAPAHELSFAVDPSAALVGRLRPGERVDVLATYGTGDSAYTIYAARGVPLLAATGDPDRALTSASSQLTLTVALDTPEQVQRLAHAVATARVAVVRSTATDPEAGGTPPPYRSSDDAASAPLSDPAAGQSATDDAEAEGGS